MESGNNDSLKLSRLQLKNNLYICKIFISSRFYTAKKHQLLVQWGSEVPN